METVAIKMLIGMISGIGCSLISIFFEKVLLNKQKGKEHYHNISNSGKLFYRC